MKRTKLLSIHIYMKEDGNLFVKLHQDFLSLPDSTENTPFYANASLHGLEGVYDGYKKVVEKTNQELLKNKH